MQRIVVLGLKTKQTYTFDYTDEEKELSVLVFLRSKGIPMSTACFGRGICRRCYFNGDYMGCAYRLKDLAEENIETIEIEYL